MNTKNILLALAAGFMMTACDHETRNGELTLSGSAPLRILDEGGKAVDFVGGAVKVEFAASSNRKFSVTMEQGDRKAKFSGKVPEGNNWSFTLRGREIGQGFDAASLRSIQLYGPISTSIGSGGSCGFDGRWVTEDQWQKGNEDWTVAFTDASSAVAVGGFKSRREGQNYLVGSRELYCREEHRRDPGHGRWDRMSKNLSSLSDSGVKFD